MTDLTTLPDTELQTLLGDAYAEAIGRKDGDQWVAPTGAHNAYPQGATVAHEGKMWESLTPANVWEPGISGWRELTADDGTPPEWVQPSGAHDAYMTGDRVTYQGAIYESLTGGNVWSPDAHPAGWKKI